MWGKRARSWHNSRTGAQKRTALGTSPERRPTHLRACAPIRSVRFHFLRERTRHRARYRLGRGRRRLEPLPRLDLDLVVAVDARARRDEMADDDVRSEEHTSELQSLAYLVCRLLLEKKKQSTNFYRLP